MIKIKMKASCINEFEGNINFLPTDIRQYKRLLWVLAVFRGWTEMLMLPSNSVMQ